MQKFFLGWIENIERKGENAGCQHSLLFPQCFQKAFLSRGVKSRDSVVKTYSSCKRKFQKSIDRCTGYGDVTELILKIGFSIHRINNSNGFNPFSNKPRFLRVCNTSLLKTLWEKEKLLVTSNFSFSHSVFFPFRELSAISIKFDIVVCKLFQFGRD